MKLMKLFFTCLLVAGFATVGFGQLSGSGHDFSGDAWSNNTICAPCHTPHNATTTGAAGDAPLWNHSVSTTTYIAYDGFDMQATDSDGSITGISRLCLSCHDGTVGLNDFGGGPTTQTLISGSAAFGNDLNNDHPVGFTYDAALSTADGELYNPTTTESGLGLNIDDDLLFGASNDQLECASCHDVHNKGNLGSMLRISNGGSDLCITCHNK